MRTKYYDVLLPILNNQEIMNGDKSDFIIKCKRELLLGRKITSNRIGGMREIVQKIQQKI